MAWALSFVFVSTAALAIILTKCLIRWQNWIPILDVPNERSSHSLPKPRTGGIAIFLALSCGYLLWRSLMGPVLQPAQKEPWVIAGAIIFFMLGLVEDILHLSEWLRFMVQGGLSLVIATWGPRLSTITLVGRSWALSSAVSIFLTAFWYTGFINLFNFMDGIDGIAASEAMVVGLFMALVSRMPGILLMSASALGFGIYNREPSKIFMGDSGSYFLGYLLAVFSVVGTGSVPFVVYMLFLGTFIADTTVTLVRRMLRGEEWFRAHRSHYYQKLTNLGFNHSQVCGMNLGLTTFLGLSGLLYSFSGAAVQGILLFLWMMIIGVIIVSIHRLEQALCINRRAP